MSLNDSPGVSAVCRVVDDSSAGVGQECSCGEPCAVDEVVRRTCDMVDCAIKRSVLWKRMSGGSLPFVARTCYLGQHWEGLRVLGSALLACVGYSAPVVRGFFSLVDRYAGQLGSALDKAHATPRWRAQHVTMPSLLEFRRRVSQLQARGDVVGLLAHCVVRLAAVSCCPAVRDSAGVVFPKITVVVSREQEEFFAEELSAATLMVLSHGVDVCRAYSCETVAASCGVTVATIRKALRS